MFRCFVDSLVRPKNIANHINMKTGKLIGYLLLLIFITSLPTIVTIFTSDSVPEQYASDIVSDLKSADVQIDYAINNGKLESSYSSDATHVYEIGLFGEEATNSQINLSTYLVFNQNNVDIANSGKLTKNGIIIDFRAEEIEVSIFNPSLE